MYEFEKLMTSVHVQTVGMTQTSPEPSMYVKIKVDENDIITGYVIAISFATMCDSLEPMKK